MIRFAAAVLLVSLSTFSFAEHNGEAALPGAAMTQATVPETYPQSLTGLHDEFMAEKPFAHIVINQASSGVSAHPSRVRAGIAIADALVVLRGNQRRNALAVADD